MANHKSALKRIRQNEKRRVQNKYFFKTMRNALKNIREESDKKKAETALPDMFSIIDKLTKNNIIHKNKAANLKSGLAQRIAAL